MKNKQYRISESEMELIKSIRAFQIKPEDVKTLAVELAIKRHSEEPYQQLKKGGGTNE